MFLLLQGILPLPVPPEYIKEIEDWLAWKEERDEKMMEKLGNAYITKAEYEKLIAPDERANWQEEVGRRLSPAVLCRCHMCSGSLTAILPASHVWALTCAQEACYLAVCKLACLHCSCCLPANHPLMPCLAKPNKHPTGLPTLLASAVSYAFIAAHIFIG